MSEAINFPHLGIYLDHVGKNFSVFGIEIAYYGVTIAVAMLAGIFLALHVAKITGQNPDDYFDMAIAGIIVCVICARLYYVIFSWDQYKDDLLSILNTRGGGLAIYGGVIGAILTMVYFNRKKKIPFGLLGDTASCGIVLGQIIGRWGNFFNREAFGGYTDNLLAMQLPLDAVRSGEVTDQMMAHLQVIGGVQFIQVHPTFLYESLWNVGVLIFLLYKIKRRKFNGEVFLCYLGGYGLGRAWIEGLRTDQLLLPVVHWHVSQLLAGVMVVISILLIVLLRRRGDTWYFYFCAKDQNGESCIGMAWAKHPEGPFTACEKPFITMPLAREWGLKMGYGGQTIDPSIYQEGEEFYLLFGNGHPAIGKLNEKMDGLVPGTIQNLEGLFDFREAVSVKKRGGLYHFTWSCDDTGSEDYHINYGTSRELYGPVEYQYAILTKEAERDIYGTGHHSIVQLPGSDCWKIAYHRFGTPTEHYPEGKGFHRETCIADLTFDENGLMEKVRMWD